MFDRYKEPYDYLKTEAQDIKMVVAENRMGFTEKLRSIPGFFKEGLAHVTNVRAIFPLMILKVVLVLLVTSLSVFAAYYGTTLLSNGNLAESLIHSFPEDMSVEDINGWLHAGLYGVIGLPYLALSLLIQGVFNGAMGAATYLHARGQPVTVGAALNIAKRQAPTIWKFSIIQQIFMTLTSRSKNEGFVGGMAKAALRVAWKFGTIGMMPAILNGRSLVDAVKRSIEFLKTAPAKVTSLILIKQIVMLILGLGIIGVGFLTYVTQFLPLLVFIPAILILMILIEPIYITMVYMLYVGFLKEKNYPLEVTPGLDSGTFTTWVLAVYVICTGGVFILAMA